jgi:hypothetical protein
MANNRLSGSIPATFGNLTSMRHPQIRRIPGPSFPLRYRDRIDVIWKGQQLMFRRTIWLLTSIDLSGNFLSRCIPEELANLQGLRFLNLSRNHLSCSIPKDIGRLIFLEALDLSFNELSGVIPLSISSISGLSMLNVSHNLLWGKIPAGTQIQTLTDPTIYSNNFGLCGFPLDIPCGDTLLASDERYGDGVDHWMYYYVVAGILFGLWIWFGMLFTSEAWRCAFLFFVDDMQCKIMHHVSC